MRYGEAATPLVMITFQRTTMPARLMQRGRGDPRFSLVFPTFNAGAGLERTWTEVSAFLTRMGPDWEVIFVCDGCTDGSQEFLEKHAHELHGRIRVLSYSPNRGKGYAVRYGMAAARGRWCLFTDVDLAYPFEDVVRLSEVLENGADVAIASRVHPESRLVLPSSLLGYAYRRHLQSLAFSMVARWLLPLTQRDTQAGLKGLSARAMRLVLPHLLCDGFGFDCELLTGCIRFGLSIQEVPVCVRYDDAKSTTGMQTMWGMVRDLLKIRRTWRLAPEIVSETTCLEAA
jgi:glycosyltransferase involved in cell wall biosynthesis